MRIPWLSAVFRADEQEQMVVFRTLAALLASRVPLVEALDECRDSAAGDSMRLCLMRIRDRVSSGGSLSEALADETTVPPVVTVLVRTAENTGTMATALQEAADILEMRLENTRNLSSALIYPAVIMGITFLAAIFLATTILPQLESMYHQAGKELPLLTRCVATGGMIVALSVALAVIGGVLAAIAGKLRQRNSVSSGRHDRSTPPHRFNLPNRQLNRLLNHLIFPIADRIPALRSVNEAHGTALWTHCLGILLTHGIPLTDALDLTARTAVSTKSASELDETRNRIIAGESPAHAFSGITTAPSLARRLLAGGDTAGNLADACARVHQIYDAEYRNRTRRLLVLAEPLAVVVAGAFVILVALAVLLPVADLGGLL